MKTNWAWQQMNSDQRAWRQNEVAYKWKPWPLPEDVGPLPEDVAYKWKPWPLPEEDGDEWKPWPLPEEDKEGGR